MVELAAFLGNPGQQYQNNRHNAAWLFAQTLPFYGSLSWKDKFKSSYAPLERRALASCRGTGDAVDRTPEPEDAAGRPETGDAGAPEFPEKIHLLLPHTFMNLSGEAVGKAASFFKIAADKILIVHDELELPLGTVSLKYSGGLGGHNGLRSMNAVFGGPDFWRLRIGIGRPDHRDIYSWVLSDFSPEEAAVLGGVFDELGQFFMDLLLRGPEAMPPEWKKKIIIARE
jgi:PTH1 family peptidyl-tRNA hydrolase